MSEEPEAKTNENAVLQKPPKRYTLKKIVYLLLFTLVLLYGLLPVLFQTGFFTRAVLIPYKLDEGPQPVLSNGIKAEQIFFKNRSGDKLCAWYFKNPRARRVIVFDHGNAGNISHRLYFAEVFTRCGASVFLFDYRGYGSSDGTATIPGIVDDGLSAYDYVQGQLGYAPQDIIVAGESIGSAVALTVASNRPCDRILLQAPLRSLASVSKFHFPFLRIYPDFVFPQLDNVNTINKIHVPLLLIHGVRDTLIPFDNSTDLLSVANQPARLVPLPHCGHNDIGLSDTDVYAAALSDFIADKQ